MNSQCTEDSRSSSTSMRQGPRRTRARARTRAATSTSSPSGAITRRPSTSTVVAR
jgi:hypothetical protein